MKTTSRRLAFLGAAVLVAVLSIGGGVIGARLGAAPEEAALPSGLRYGSPAESDAYESDSTFEMTRIVNTPSAFTTANQADVARAFQQQFRSVAAQTLPVVVEVNVVNRVTQRTGGTPFDFFFGTPREGQQEREFERPGMGSGVIVARDGETVYVLTNDHVAGDADEIEIVLYDNRTFSAELVGTDELIDLALVSFQTGDEVPIAPLGDSDALLPGDWVFAVGNPLGFQSTITAGIVSATARAAQPGSQMSGITDYIQTDAAINRGNSGGPLVNLDGEVVGINTWIASQTGGSIGLGFAIPVNNAKRAITDFLTEGEVAYSWLGVSISTVGESLAEPLGLDEASGAFVSGVYEGSPAATAGILPGDVIVRIDDVEIDSSNTLVRTVANLEPGARASFQLIRAGERMTMTVRTGRRTAESDSETPIWPGITVAPLTDEIRDQLELARRIDGVVVAAVAANSAASDSGIRAGDTITAVNGTGVDSLVDFYRELGASRDGEVQFRIIREGRQIILGFVRGDA